MTTLVVGRGLLGGHLSRQLVRGGDTVRHVDVPWREPEAALQALLVGVGAAAEADPEWRLAWCAGAGVVATPGAAAQAEVELFASFLDAIGPVPSVLFLASSAGGVYAGSPDHPPFTESSRTGALAPYGEAKLRMEQAARDFAGRGSRVVLARLANLYGPGQDLSKPQGLVSQLCVSQLTQQPLGLYVSLDTLRDYLYVADAAAMSAACLDRVAEEPPGSVVTKIVASGRAVSVASVLGQLTRVVRARPRLSTRTTAHSARQVLDLRLRSEVWPEVDRLVHTSLTVGLRATLDAVGAQLREGHLRVRF